MMSSHKEGGKNPPVHTTGDYDTHCAYLREYQECKPEKEIDWLTLAYKTAPTPEDRGETAELLGYAHHRSLMLQKAHGWFKLAVANYETLPVTHPEREEKLRGPRKIVAEYSSRCIGIIHPSIKEKSPHLFPVLPVPRTRTVPPSPGLRSTPYHQSALASEQNAAPALRLTERDKRKQKNDNGWVR